MTDLDDALARLAMYSGDVYDPVTRPYGFDGEDGVPVNWVRSLRDAATVGRFVSTTYSALVALQTAWASAAQPGTIVGRPAGSGVGSMRALDAPTARAAIGLGTADAPSFAGLKASGAVFLGSRTTAVAGETILMSPAASVTGATVKIGVASSGSGDGSPNVAFFGVDGAAISGRAFFDTGAYGVASPTPLDLRVGGTTILSATVSGVSVGAGCRLEWGGTGTAYPTFNSQSSGTKIVLFPLQSSNTVDFAFGVAPGVLWSSVGSSTNAFHWYAGTTQILSLNGTGTLTCGGSVLFAADNAYSIGSATNRAAQVFVATGAVSSSDGAMKTIRGDGAFTEEEKRVANRLRALCKIYQFNDAIAEKGGAARLHAGWIAQDVAAAFAAEGLDASRYGLWCRDELIEEYEETETFESQKMETVSVFVETIEIVDGKAVLTTSTRDETRPVFEMLPVIDASGTPVLDAAGAPRTYQNPVMVTETRTTTKTRPSGEFRLGLRYEEVLAFVLAAA